MIKVVSISLFDPASSTFILATPSIMRGQNLGVRVTVFNDTTKERDVTVNVPLTAPDGTVVNLTATKAIAAGATDVLDLVSTSALEGAYVTLGAEVIAGPKNFTNIVTNGKFATGAVGGLPTGWLTQLATGVIVTDVVKFEPRSVKLTMNTQTSGNPKLYQDVTTYLSYLNKQVSISAYLLAPATDTVGSPKMSSHTNTAAVYGLPIVKDGKWHNAKLTLTLPLATANPVPAHWWPNAMLSGISTVDYMYISDFWACLGDCTPGTIFEIPGMVVANVGVTTIERMMQMMIPLMGIMAIGKGMKNII